MKFRFKKVTLISILLVALLTFYFGAFYIEPPFFVVITAVLICYLASIKNNPADISFYFPALVGYAGVNFGYLYIAQLVSYEFMKVFILGSFIFLFVHALNNNTPKRFFNVSSGLLWSVYALCVSIILLVKVIYWRVGGDFAKGVNMLLSEPLLLMLYGAYFGLLVERRNNILCTMAPLLLYQVVVNSISSDISRLHIVIFVAMTVFGLYFRFKNNGVLKFPSLLIFIGVISLFTMTGLALGGVKFGGDSLVFNYAVKIIELVREQEEYQPYMAIHNGGGILIPEIFWLGSKPKTLNPSSWYLANIMNLDPADYPWGIGVTSFGAAYLYGGYLGVVLLFGIYGLISKFVNRFAYNSFFVGVSIVFNIKLVFVMVRMDESFLLGPWIVTIPLSLYLFLLIKKRIDKNYVKNIN